MKNNITSHLFIFIFLMLFSLCSIPSLSHAQNFEILIIEPDENEGGENNPCLSFLPSHKITDKKKMEMLTEGLKVLDNEKFIGENFNKELILRAFPGLNREDFENDTYVFWDLKKFNFDGTAPIDYALFLRQSASSGPYEWVLAIRGNNKVVYQRMLGYYRGLYNIMQRAKEKSQPNQRQNPREGINKFLELANISQNPGNIDGDGKDDLLMHTHFENCDSQKDPYCGLMSNLTYMPVPYFWNGKYMSCRDKKRFQYYGKFEKLLYVLSDEDRIGISSELKKLKGESR